MNKMETLTLGLQFLLDAMTCNHGAMRTINRRRELCHFHSCCDLRPAIRNDRPSGKENLRKSTRKVFIPLTRTFVSRRKLPRMRALSPARAKNRITHGESEMARQAAGKCVESRGLLLQVFFVCGRWVVTWTGDSGNRWGLGSASSRRWTNTARISAFEELSSNTHDYIQITKSKVIAPRLWQLFHKKFIE